MNKLVIVGNGFDLAHGLPTSYRHFIDYFWSNLKNNYKDEFIKRIVFANPAYFRAFIIECKNFKEFSKNLKEYARDYGYPYDDANFECHADNSKSSPVFQFKNEFFKTLNLKSLNNWVDIENEYYQELKRIFKQKPLSVRGRRTLTQQEQELKNKDQAKTLNLEFEQIKKLFEKYLSLNISDSYNLNEFSNTKWIGLYNDLKPISPFQRGTRLLEEFTIEEDRKEIKDLMVEEKLDNQLFTKTLVLNFNYTLCTSQYIYQIYQGEYENYIIHIHGVLNNKDNPVNFGFGDEMDEDYKLIENLNDNEYLKNFKSFKYSQNSNYKRLLDYIDSYKFQVYIMGHSCGLSDRTLLNTIFEHDHCRSIKVFYHQREDSNDNFTEIIQNISRHFNDKKMMRAKVVNKSLCSPLPQNIRFQRKDS